MGTASSARASRSTGGAGGLGGDGTFADLGTAEEGGTFFDRESACGDIAHEHGVGLEFTTLLHGDVTLDLPENGDRTGLDLPLDQRILAHGQRTVGSDLTINLPIDDQVMGKFDGAFDFDVIGKDVFARGHV